MITKKRWLLVTVVVNIAASVGHYVDNIVRFDEYPEPPWLNPQLVDLFWFVMTPFAIVGYVLYARGRATPAFRCLFAYAIMSLFVLGHYLITPPWEISFSINFWIIVETVAALGLLIVIRWLGTGHPG